MAYERKKIVDVLELFFIWYRAKKQKRRVLKSEVKHFYESPKDHPGCKNVFAWFYMCDNLYAGKGYGKKGEDNRQGMLPKLLIGAVKLAEKKSQATY